MENETKLSPGQINSLMGQLKSGASEVGAQAGLTPEQLSSVQRVLENPQRLQELLSSPAARRIIEALSKKE